MTATIGLVGVGRIGRSIGHNLLQAGYALHVHDLEQSSAAGLVEAGAIWHDTPATLTRASTFILLSLFGSDSVHKVLSAEQGICSQNLAGKYVIDTTTIPPQDARQFARLVTEQQGHYLDAPITGGEGGAQSGTLTIMVGGDADAFAECEAVLRVIGEKIAHLGESGAGQYVKMANQGIMASAFVTIAETIRYLEAAHVDMPGALDVLTTGGASSKVLKGMSSRYLAAQNGAQADEETRHYSALFEKDSRYVWQSAEQLAQPLSMVKLAYDTIKQVIDSETYAVRFPLNILQWIRESRTAERSFD